MSTRKMSREESEMWVELGRLQAQAERWEESAKHPDATLEERLEARHKAEELRRRVENQRRKINQLAMGNHD